MSTLTSTIVAPGTTAPVNIPVTDVLAHAFALVVSVSAFTSGTVTVQVFGQTASGYTYPIITSAALAATGTTVLRIGQGLAPVANQSVNDIVPQNLLVTVSGAFVATYGIDAVWNT